jgi:hypothetical protein
VSGNSLLQAPAITTTGFRSGPLDSDGKRIYSGNGEVFDVATGTLLGNCPARWGVDLLAEPLGVDEVAERPSEAIYPPNHDCIELSGPGVG